jgi:hypothetical protein
VTPKETLFVGHSENIVHTGRFVLYLDIVGQYWVDQELVRVELEVFEVERIELPKTCISSVA